MLLNLSNHPSTKWSNEQMDIAQKLYGRVVDIPFPHISPTENTEGVVVLAEKYCRNIVELSSQEDSLTVHLMGELSFCFALVKLLQQNGIQVVCSTTERTVIEEKNGLKTAQFRFHQFRDYPHL